MVRSPVDLNVRARAQVAYLTMERAWLLDVELRPGDQLQDLVERSGLLQQVPGLDLRQTKVGIFGRLCELTAPVRSGDRIEIYRPLSADPKAARRQRAAHKTKGGARRD